MVGSRGGHTRGADGLYAMCIVAYYAAVPWVGCLDVRGATMFANREP